MNDILNNLAKGACGIAAAFGLASCASSNSQTGSPLDEIVPSEDPGLHGPDENQDGVRDYIADYLIETYSGDGPDKAEKIETMLGLARSIQFQIDNADNWKALHENANYTVLPYISCMVAMRDEMPMQKIMGEIRFLSTNTREREAAFRRAERNLGGGVFKSGDTTRGHEICPTYLRG